MNSTYKESNILIKGETVPCYHSEITDIYLIGLMNDKGDISFYRYDASNDKFYSYSEINVSGLFISLVQNDNVLSGYNKGVIKIGDKEYDGFVKDDSYSLIYGINLETGEQNFYSYDSFEGTLQRYSINNGSDNRFNCYIIYGLIGLCVFEFIMIIVSVISKNRQLKKVLHSKLDIRTEYEKSLDSDDSYNDEENITDDLTDEYISSDITNNTDDESDDVIDETNKFDDSDETSSVSDNLNDETSESNLNLDSSSEDDEENLGHTALISRDLNNVFDNSVNKKERKKRKRSKDSDDEMFKF